MALRKDDVFMKHILCGKIRSCVCAKVRGAGNKGDREAEKPEQSKPGLSQKVLWMRWDKDTNILKPQMFP